MLFLPGMRARPVSPLLLPNIAFLLLLSITAILSPGWLTGGQSRIEPAVLLAVSVAVYLGSLGIFLGGRRLLTHPWAAHVLLAIASAAMLLLCLENASDPPFLGAAAFAAAGLLAAVSKKPRRAFEFFGLVFPLLWLAQAITGFDLAGLRNPNLAVLFSPVGVIFSLSFLSNLIFLWLPRYRLPVWKAGWYGAALGLALLSLAQAGKVAVYPQVGILAFFTAVFFLNDRAEFDSADLFDFDSDERRMTWLMGATLLLVTFGVKIYSLRLTANLSEMPVLVDLGPIPALGWIGLCGISLAVMITLLMRQQARLLALWQQLSPDTPEGEDQALGQRLHNAVDKVNGALARSTAHSLALTAQLSEIGSNEKQLRQKFLSLISLTQQLNAQLDPPVTAQMTANLLQRAIGCGLTAILFYSPEDNRFFPIATAGSSSISLPAGFRIKSREGLIQRALKMQRATLLNPGTASEDTLRIGETTYNSILTVPMITNGYHEGVIILADQRAGFFSPDDITLAEAVTDRLVSAWQQARGNQTLETLIKEGITLTNINDPQTILRLVADIGRKLIKAQHAVVIANYQSRLLSAQSGPAAGWTEKLTASKNELLEEFLRLQQPLRVRDTGKDPRFRRLIPAANRPRSLMVVPILSRGEGLGILLLAGKKNGLIFEERDAFLGSVLASQASAAFENCLLNEDLRNNLHSTQLLYTLSNRIEASPNLEQAAQAITDTALKLTQAAACGLTLFSLENQVEVSTITAAEAGKRRHPQAMIRQVLQSRQIVYLDKGDQTSLVCFPLQTARRVFGALWIELQESDENRRSSRTTEELRMLINQATVALERSVLLAETREQADALSGAYANLEEVYDQTLTTLMSALDARDHETEGHCSRVTELALALGRHLELSPAELKSLERGALLHDIGKIGIGDAILHKPGPLTEDEWVEMRKHPVIGAKILEGIPFLRDAIPVVAGHQERFDGSGYPLGLNGEQIPILARIFAAADVFDALISDRPYHEKKPIRDALDYMREKSGSEFDPQVIDKLMELTREPQFLESLGYEDAA